MPFLLAVCLWAQLFIQLHKCLLCGLPWPVQRHALCSFSCSGKAPANNTTGHIAQPAGRAARSVAPSPGLSVAFPVNIDFLTWHPLFRALFGGYSWDHVSHLACSDLSEEGSASFPSWKAATPTLCPSRMPQVVPCTLPRMCWTGGRCTALTIYFERPDCFKLLVPLKTALFKYRVQAGVSK